MATYVKTYVICDNCSAEFLGHSTKHKPAARRIARAKAVEAGWLHKRRSYGKHTDLCPLCKDK